MEINQLLITAGSIVGIVLVALLAIVPVWLESADTEPLARRS